MCLDHFSAPLLAWTCFCVDKNAHRYWRKDFYLLNKYASKNWKFEQTSENRHFDSFSVTSRFNLYRDIRRCELNLLLFRVSRSIELTRRVRGKKHGSKRCTINCRKRKKENGREKINESCRAIVHNRATRFEWNFPS